MKVEVSRSRGVEDYESEKIQSNETEIGNKERSSRKVKMLLKLYDNEMKIRIRGWKQPFKYSNFAFKIIIRLWPRPFIPT